MKKIILMKEQVKNKAFGLLHGGKFFSKKREGMDGLIVAIGLIIIVIIALVYFKPAIGTAFKTVSDNIIQQFSSISATS